MRRRFGAVVVSLAGVLASGLDAPAAAFSISPSEWAAAGCAHHETLVEMRETVESEDWPINIANHDELARRLSVAVLAERAWPTDSPAALAEAEAEARAVFVAWLAEASADGGANGLTFTHPSGIDTAAVFAREFTDDNGLIFTECYMVVGGVAELEMSASEVAALAERRFVTRPWPFTRDTGDRYVSGYYTSFNVELMKDVLPGSPAVSGAAAITRVRAAP